MNAIEPSEARVNAAARAMQREDPVPMQMFTFNEICDLARAALLADAPALVDARIDSLDTVIDKLDVETETARWLLPGEGAGAVVLTLNDIKRSVELEIERLQADLDKERGKTI